MDIDNLWTLHDENEWLDALNRYWVNPTVCKNRDIEQSMHNVDLEYVQRLESKSGMTSLTNISTGNTLATIFTKD